MKKIVSAMALCVVLFGTIMMVTGCGSKPKADTVWKVEKITATGVSITVPGEMYFCFHSDGNAYTAMKMLTLTASKLGTYTIGKKDITIKGDTDAVSFPYTLKGEKMTLDLTADLAKKLSIPSLAGSAQFELQKVSNPSAADIKKAAK